MKFNKLNSIIVLGLVAIVGIIVAQLLWTKEAFGLEEKKFSQKVHVSLLEVVKSLYEGTNHDLPTESPIEKMANDYYIVNVANDFEPDILEFYLKSEFKKMGIATDFEYAIYNCSSDAMVYGNYVSMTSDEAAKKSVHFPKHKNLVYYFAIRFPNETSYLFSSLKFWFVLSFALVVILLVYVYSIFTILQQRKYSELQRDFINNMTHEFKTPLSSILLASNYLMKQQAIQSDEKLQKYTGIIIDQSNKLNSHIGKILNVAKSDGAPLELEKTTIDVSAVILDVIENIKLKHETIAISFSADGPISIVADAFHFTNIVYNLIDNSIKYCDGTPEIVINATVENATLKLTFKDNGIGVPAKQLPFIFDKFYRIPSVKSNEVNGFGLGLYYVKKICTLHGWKISAENNPSKGIAITLTIPMR
ncbi:histidine kinase [Flavobacterium longum]|uniref:sensor histidine kinase n=1 Tax=Flavobacterium longum TaxID=1299340 RepID=UPI0039E84A1D